ncbi:MAG: phosphatase, Ppx/GppA family, partial [Bacteriovoracaceae bacterium]|nr:phosphatase, Ppx/GppA family [Bacteriovoracaceae bacterium]
RKVLRSGSFLLGTARLQQIFLKTIPPALGVKEKSNPIENLRRNIRGVLLYRLVSEEWPKVSRIIGSSGTIRALVKISKKETGSEVIQREYLDHLVTRMIKMSRAELAAIPGMEPRRVDMILAGAILLQECMNAVHASRAELTEFSLRDGILDEQMELLKSQKKEKNIHLVHDFILAAKRLGANEAELHQAIKISETLFDLLKPVHKLTFEWKVYLTIASILQGSGKAISSIEYENHSAYISKNLDIVGLSDLERRLISELCIQHRNGRILKKEAPFKKNKKLQRGFFKLLALLRLSGALSLQRAKPIKIEKVSFKGKIVKILISKRYAPDLEILRAEQKKQLFEEVFRRQLILELV